MLVDVLRQINERIRIVRMQDFLVPERVERTIREHVALIDAVLAGDIVEAEGQLVTHIDSSVAVVEERVTKAIARMAGVTARDRHSDRTERARPERRPAHRGTAAPAGRQSTADTHTETGARHGEHGSDGHGTQQVAIRPSGRDQPSARRQAASPGASATWSPTTRSTSPSAPARSTPCSARTAPARAP